MELKVKNYHKYNFLNFELFLLSLHKNTIIYYNDPES
jgi:hypothetical protein